MSKCNNYCTKCGENFFVHNDDGSCIQDEPQQTLGNYIDDYSLTDEQYKWLNKIADFIEGLTDDTIWDAIDRGWNWEAAFDRGSNAWAAAHEVFEFVKIEVD